MPPAEQQAKEIEVRPRGKVLFINMSTSPEYRFKIASKMFEVNSNDISDFSEMLLTNINAPEGFVAGSLEQSKQTTIDLPENIDDLVGVVINGSPFTAVLLNRELRKLDIDRDGKGLFLPFWQRDLINFIKRVDDAGKPMLGVCFGAEMITEALGGKVERMKQGDQKLTEKGWSVVEKSTSDEDPILDALPYKFVVPQNHMYTISRVPPGASVLAENQYGVQMFRKGKIWGVQFHPEKNTSDIDAYYNDPKIVEKLKEQGVDLEDAKKLGQGYSPALMSGIFTNFLKYAWAGVQ